MGGPIFDRQVFVKKNPAQPPPLSQSLLPGGLVLVLVAALSAFATYRYVKAGGTAPSNSADKAQIEQLQSKLKTMQARLDELEKRRHPSPAKRVAGNVKPGNAKPAAGKPTNPLLAESAPHPSGHVTTIAHHSTVHAAVNGQHSTVSATASDAPHNAPAAAVQQPSPEHKVLLAKTQPAPNKELSVLQGNLAASHDEWRATANRLGNVVGELDSQRTALQKNQNSVNYLLERVHRSDVSFTLKKGSALQRVGPISMKLADTSVKDQHYSIRMFVGDKSVELKDRALNEIVQFYTSRSQHPLRLIVSQIERGQVSGTLAVPDDLSQQVNNPQFQER